MKKLEVLTLGKYIKKKVNGVSIYDFLLKKKFKLKYYGEFKKVYNLEKYDLVICYGYGLILKDTQINKTSPKIINLHIGYLPFARGIYPLLWSIIYNKSVGVTFHTIENEKIDAGRIVYRKKIKYNSSNTLKDIHQFCLKQINYLFIKKFDFLIKKSKLKRIQISKYYFKKKLSHKLLLALPQKWNTKVSYLKKNSVKLKKIYTNY